MTYWLICFFPLAFLEMHEAVVIVNWVSKPILEEDPENTEVSDTLWELSIILRG